MSQFTDEDLKRFKKNLTVFDDWNCQECGLNMEFDLKALIVRLEAAEKVCDIVGGSELHTTHEWIKLIAPAVEVWRKSRGRDKERE